MKKINDVISKAIMDENFRREFLQDPIKATEGFGLSQEEIAKLSEIDLSELNQVNAELEERLSKSFINLPSLGEDEEMYHSSSHVNHTDDSHGDASW